VNLQPRDKRALIILAAVAGLMLIYWIASSSPSSPAAKVAPVESIDRSEKRIAALRSAMATVDGKQSLLKKASAELAEREKGLIPGDTPEQAQAQLLQIMRRVVKSQVPPLDMRQTELAQPKSYGDAYARVTVSVMVDCRIDELVNLLASLSAQPELIATDEIRCGAANAKTKVMQVRLTVSGLVPHKLLPAKKGVAAL